MSEITDADVVYDYLDLVKGFVKFGIELLLSTGAEERIFILQTPSDIHDRELYMVIESLEEVKTVLRFVRDSHECGMFVRRLGESYKWETRKAPKKKPLSKPVSKKKPKRQRVSKSK